MTRKEQRISTGPNKRREAKAIDFSKYCHIINKEETEGFFDALKYSYKMILDYASSDNHRNKPRKSMEKVEEGVRDSTDSSTTLASKEKDNLENSPEGDYGRNSILETNRSLAESELLNEHLDNDDTFDASRGLSLSYTVDESEHSRYDEDREAKKILKKEKKRKEKQFKFAKINDSRDPTDYEIINRFLLKLHKQLDRLDSAGCTLRQIFERKEKAQFDAFRYFIMNLEVYGSFLPINDRLFDPQVTRISSYLKVCKVRKGIDGIIYEYENADGKIMKEVLLKTKMISYYFNKLEAFLSRKHKQSAHSKSAEKNQFCIDYDLEENNKEEMKSHDGSDMESNDGEESKYTPRSGLSVIEDDQDEYYYIKTLFKDFSEPDVINTGYLIPITCGHNGVYKSKEKKLLEMHLRQAEFIPS